MNKGKVKSAYWNIDTEEISFGDDWGITQGPSSKQYYIFHKNCKDQDHGTVTHDTSLSHCVECKEMIPKDVLTVFRIVRL